MTNKAKANELDKFRESKQWEECSDILDKHFPKGECQERGAAMVMLAELMTPITGYTAQQVSEAEREAKQRGKLDGLEFAKKFTLPLFSHWKQRKTRSMLDQLFVDADRSVREDFTQLKQGEGDD